MATRSYAASQRRADKTRRKAKAPKPKAGFCTVEDCWEKVRAATEASFDFKLCRKHADFQSRHGSTMAKSYPVAVANPYRRAALEYVLANLEDIVVSHAIADVGSLFRRAAHVEATSLRGMKPAARAAVAFARLRKAEVDRRLVVAAGVAVAMMKADRLQSDPSDTYAHVQIAKIVHRLGSGTHKYWPTNAAYPELHKFPKSRGLVLVKIGEAVAGAVAQLVAERLPDILAFKAARRAAGKPDTSAKSKRIQGRKRTPKPEMPPRRQKPISRSPFNVSGRR